MKKLLNVFLMMLCLLWLGVGCVSQNYEEPPSLPIEIGTPGVDEGEDEEAEEAEEAEESKTEEAEKAEAEEEAAEEADMPVHVSLATSGKSQAELDAAAIISKIVFMGIKNASIRYEEDGHVYLDVLVAYDNQSGKPITISEIVSRAIFMDETANRNELTTYAYSDFCDITKPGCQLRDFYAKFDCGFYVPKESKARLSQVFKPGQNEEYMTFDFGQLLDNKLDADAQERLKADGYAKGSQLMILQEPMMRLLRLYNTMNGADKNDGKFVLLGEGVANYNGPKGTVIIGKVFIAAVLDRTPFMFIYANENI